MILNINEPKVFFTLTTSIGFVKDKGRLSVFVNDKYSNPKMWKKYPSLKGTNAYTSKQIKIFLEWFNEEKSKKEKPKKD